MDDSEELGDIHSTNQMMQDFSESSEICQISQLSTMADLTQPLILTSSGIPLITSSLMSLISRNQAGISPGEPVVSLVENSDDLTAQLVDLQGDYQPVIEASVDQLPLVLNRLTGAYSGGIDLQSILRSLNQSMSGSDQLTFVFSSVPPPVVSGSNELTLVYSNGQPVLQSSIDSNLLNPQNVITTSLASTGEEHEVKQLISQGSTIGQMSTINQISTINQVSMDGSVEVKLDLDGTTSEGIQSIGGFVVGEVVPSSDVVQQYVNMPQTDVISEQGDILMSLPETVGSIDAVNESETLQTLKIDRGKKVVTISRPKRQVRGVSKPQSVASITDNSTVAKNNEATASISTAAQETKSDLQNELENISEKIKLLKKRLAAVVSRKVAYLKQVEELSGMEQDLLAQLRIETSREKDVASKIGTKITSGVTMKSDQNNSKDGKGFLGSSQEKSGDKLKVTALSTPQWTDVMSYLTPIESQKDFLSILLKEEKLLKEGGDDHHMQTRSRSTRGRKRKAGKDQQQLDEDNEELTTLDDSILQDDDDDENKKKRQRTKVASRVPVKCDTCNRSFRINYHLQRHKNNGCDGNQSHPCEVCGKEFINASRLKAHAQTHVRGEHNCEHCGRTLASRYQLQLHVRQHEGDLRQLCSVCGKAFVDYHALRQHMVGHSRPHACDVCGRRFSRVKDMRVHRRLHTGECFFSCGICRKAFATATMLRRHQLTHNPIKEQICGVCQRGFHHISELRIHMRIHTGEEVYRCIECNMGFTGRYQWNKHQWDVHNVPKKTRTCEICGKVCTTPSNLRNHLRSHSMDKPHKCMLCEKQYKNAHDLMVHEKKKHNVSSNLSHKDLVNNMELNAIQVQPFVDIQLNGLDHQQLHQQQLIDLQQLGAVQQYVDVQQLSSLQQQLNAVGLQHQLGVVTSLDQLTGSDIRII